MDVHDLYQAATGHAPYPYQAALATSIDLPNLLYVPTGVGKTAAATLAWLYRRRYAPSDIQKKTPRRLVYCLPMRTLVEQTRNAVLDWLAGLGIPSEGENGIGVHLLMGGTDAGDWYAHPERNAILIGTQDMLLSRALNRGYGMSRYLWPVQFALLNNDVLWVLDETQLMGVGLTTSAQLAGLRRKLNVYGRNHTLWMSATLDADQLSTIDHPKPRSGSWTVVKIESADVVNERVAKLLNARKICKRAAVSLNLDTKDQYPRSLADFIQASHVAGTLTLVVLNRVARAQEVFSSLQKHYAKLDVVPELALVHSRFRKADRDGIQSRALNDESISTSDQGRIVIATQAIEAGVDISATTLITEIAPWSSLVQRFGRCNRRGKCGIDGLPEANVYWIDIDTTDTKKSANNALPYDPLELDVARNVIAKLDDVGPATLSAEHVETPKLLVHVLRRKDLVELFDTTPDLSGNDLDVSRYIREGDNTDAHVYWRQWDLTDGTPPQPIRKDGAVAFPAACREELCNVSVAALRGNSGFVKKARDKGYQAYTWNSLDKQWQSVHPNAVRPGMTLLFHAKVGGYDPHLGWTGELKNSPVSDLRPEAGLLEDSMDSDDTAATPLTISQHLKDVGESAEQLTRNLLDDASEIPSDAVIRAAWWHDVGKAHPAFQGALFVMNDALDVNELWAKSGRRGYLRYQVSSGKLPADYVDEVASTDAVLTAAQYRPGFRHELASAIAWLQQYPCEENADLIAYLIAAHHGKVRLSIRSMPNEQRPPNTEQLFARGIWEGDCLPAVKIGNVEQDVSEEVSLSLECMRLGNSNSGFSWLSRSIALRDQYGPFRLAFLETLVRVADWRGSAKGESR